MIGIVKKTIKLPEGAEGYLYIEIRPHKEFTEPHIYTKIEKGQREVKLPKGLNPKKVVKIWVSDHIYKDCEAFYNDAQ